MKLKDAKLIEYRTLAAFLGNILGEDYAIALFSEDDTENPLYTTENMPLDPDLIRQSIEAAKALPFDYLCGFADQGKMPAIERAAVYPIRGEETEILGYLYFLKKFSEKVDLKEVVVNVLKADSAESSKMDTQISKVIYEKAEEIYAPYRTRAKLKKAEKVDMMRQFFDAGITKLRGGIAIISEVTGISQASLYRYLLEVIEE